MDFKSHKTKIMGILNVTPDSFSDAGTYFNNTKKAVKKALQMVEHGADIIDIGGESTRPNADPVSLKEELRRVIPVIREIKSKIKNKALISIDTYKSEVAKLAVENGADIINDVSGLQMDKDMPRIAALCKVPIIINHMNGNPKTMQKGEIVYGDVIKDIKKFFQRQIKILENSKVLKENIILDPGFGFGKTLVHNLLIVKKLREFLSFNLPIIIGVSRKSSLELILKEEFGNHKSFPINQRLEASLAVSAIAVCNGANILRVHDVYQTKKFFAVFDSIRNINL